MRFPALAPQSEIDRQLSRTRPRLTSPPSLPWGEALLGLMMLVLLQSIG